MNKSWKTLMWLFVGVCCATIAWHLFEALCGEVSSFSDSAYDSAYEMRITSYQQSPIVASGYADTNAMLAGLFYVLLMGVISVAFFGGMLVGWNWILGVVKKIDLHPKWLIIILLMTSLFGTTLLVYLSASQTPQVVSMSIREPSPKINGLLKEDMQIDISRKGWMTPAQFKRRN